MESTPPSILGSYLGDFPIFDQSLRPEVPDASISGTDMTGRPGYRTMEMIGGSSAPYLARSPCVPLFCTSFNRVGNKERFRLPGAGGGSFPLYGGTFARSYSVSSIASSLIFTVSWVKGLARPSSPKFEIEIG